MISYSMKKIRVRLKQNGYDVMVGAGLLRRAGRELVRLLPTPASRVFVVTSPNVRRHWGEQLEKSLRQSGLPYQVLEMSDGEPSKRLQTVEQLAEQLMDARADRKSLLVAFGGGVVGDCAGFLAAVFLRGIPVVQIPTTFLRGCQHRRQDRRESPRREEPGWRLSSAPGRAGGSGSACHAR